MVRELAETSYQFDRPFELDSSAYVSTFGEPATPMPGAVAATVAWWRRRSASAAA